MDPLLLSETVNFRKTFMPLLPEVHFRKFRKYTALQTSGVRSSGPALQASGIRTSASGPALQTSGVRSSGPAFAGFRYPHFRSRSCFADFRGDRR